MYSDKPGIMYVPLLTYYSKWAFTSIVWLIQSVHLPPSCLLSLLFYIYIYLNLHLHLHLPQFTFTLKFISIVWSIQSAQLPLVFSLRFYISKGFNSIEWVLRFADWLMKINRSAVLLPGDFSEPLKTQLTEMMFSEFPDIQPFSLNPFPHYYYEYTTP